MVPPPARHARGLSTSDRAVASLARATGLAALAVLGGCTALGVAAALSLRALYADGFYYLIRIVEGGAFFAAPARQTVEWIRQGPLIAAARLGLGDLHALAVGFGLVVQLLPLLLTGLAWFALPRARKALFAFPLLHVAAGTLASAFVPIAEGATAAAYFWLLLFCVLFAPTRGGGVLLTVVLAAGTALLHEGMVFLAPVLALAALLRARGMPAGGARHLHRALAAWFVAVAVLHAYFILVPAHPENRSAFFGALLNHYWVGGFEGNWNLPALFGVLGVALVAALAAGVARGAARARSLGWAAVGLLAVASAAAVAGTEALAPSAQFNARNNGLLLSLPLSLAVLRLAWRPLAVPRWAWMQGLAVCGVLTAGALAWHAAALGHWNRHLDAFRQVLAAHRGFVPWTDALAGLTPAERRGFKAMAHGWIEPSMSIVLAPGGDVRAILGASRPERWQPFDPRVPAALPRARYWRFDAYEAALRAPR